MPLTSKGRKILASLEKQYGEKKAKQVLYAGKNKGTFTGIDSLTDDDVTRARDVLHSSCTHFRPDETGRRCKTCGRPLSAHHAARNRDADNLEGVLSNLGAYRNYEDSSDAAADLFARAAKAFHVGDRKLGIQLSDEARTLAGGGEVDARSGTVKVTPAVLARWKEIAKNHPVASVREEAQRSIREQEEMKDTSVHDRAADLYTRAAKAFRVGDRALGIKLCDEAKTALDAPNPSMLSKVVFN